MTTKHKKVLFTVIGIVFWLALWEITARSLNIRFIFPAFSETVYTLFGLLLTGKFYLTVIFSIGRIVLGFIIGCALGFLLGALSHVSLAVLSIVKPVMTVIRATPVASIIIILWFFASKDYIPLVIGLFMVCPIIWQSTFDSLHVKNRELTEVADLFCLSGKKRIKILILPTISKYLLPAVVTSSALAWKSGVAAEIITYTKLSIGFEIADAKNAYEGAEMFAWTLTVVLLSVVIEQLIRLVIRRLERKWA